MLKIFVYLNLWHTIDGALDWGSKCCCVVSFNCSFYMQCLVLGQPGKTGNHPDMTDKLLTGR